MLLAITDYCSMGCTHCLSDCTTAGAHITKEQLAKNLDFAQRVLKNDIGHALIVSGGEPFEHPEIKDILEIIGSFCDKTPQKLTFVLTNGYALANDMSLLNWYRDFTKNHRNVYTQVTNNEKYYPKRLTDKNKYYLGKIRKCLIFDDIKDASPLYPQGRALALKEPSFGTYTPKCSNLRLLANQSAGSSFKHIVNSLPSKGQCTPRIHIDGSVALGESRLCPAIGTVDDDDSTLFKSAKSCRCAKCSVAMEYLRETNSLAYNLIMG